MSSSPPTQFTPSQASKWTRPLQGVLILLSELFFLLGWFWQPGIKKLKASERYEHGLTIILPGIEGRSFLNQNTARGVAASGFPGAIEIYDWTTGIPLLFLHHLRFMKRNKKIAQKIAQKIIDYQEQYPGRPVYLLGHSGGGAMALWTLEALPDEIQVDAVGLLAPSLSPEYDLTNALKHVRHEIVNFYSWGDLFFLFLFTTVFGTLDGKFSPCAGAVGFQEHGSRAHRLITLLHLKQVGYEWKYLRQYHLSGHFGCSNPFFVAEIIMPTLYANQQPAN